eukprot:4133511-Alexandrium_andersonii.AAC.1
MIARNTHRVAGLPYIHNRPKADSAAMHEQEGRRTRQESRPLQEVTGAQGAAQAGVLRSLGSGWIPHDSP